MKNYFLLFFLTFIGWTGLSAQVFPSEEPLEPVSNDCGISFDYDNAGNRVKRYRCLNNLEPAFRTEMTEDGQLVNTLDLERTVRGYSEVLESEIEQLEALLSQPSNLDLKSNDKSVVALTDENFSSLATMVVFPNPTMSTFSIQGEGLNPEATVSIISMDGRILSQRVLADGRDIDVSSLPVGSYVVTVVHDDERRVSMLIKSEQP
ncbi:MAG: T9SS type A sorting domain-containing protein [Bacteroidota bacterium]